MPSETFFNLPPEKRAKLMDAVRGELARVPFPELSINRIVHAAGVSRGSYYMYFADKDDLYAYLVRDYATAMQECAQAALQRSRGDVFRTMLAGFDVAVDFAASQTDMAAFRNLFSCGSGQDPLAFERTAGGTRCSLLADNMALIDTKSLACSDERGLMNILEILLSTLRFSLAELFAEPARAGEIRARLAEKLDLIQYGVLARDADNGRNAADAG